MCSTIQTLPRVRCSVCCLWLRTGDQFPARDEEMRSRSLCFARVWPLLIAPRRKQDNIKHKKLLFCVSRVRSMRNYWLWRFNVMPLHYCIVREKFAKVHLIRAPLHSCWSFLIISAAERWRIKVNKESRWTLHKQSEGCQQTTAQMPGQLWRFTKLGETHLVWTLMKKYLLENV